MAAWNAKVDSVTPSENKLSVNVSYYDASDVGFSNTLGGQTFIFEAGTSLPNIQRRIIDAATLYRSAYNKKDTYVGAVINVP